MKKNAAPEVPVMAEPILSTAPLAWAEQCADGKLRHGVHGLTQDGTEAQAAAKRYTETEAAALDRARHVRPSPGGWHLRVAGMIAQEASAAYERRIAELRAADAGPLDLFLDLALDALDAAMRADEAHGGLDE